MNTPLDAYWMPFTANRQFKKAPRMLKKSAEGMYYWTTDGRQILDGVAGLWCCNAGHNTAEDCGGGLPADRPDGLRAPVPDGTPEGLRAGQPVAGDGAGRVSAKVFFTNSGSESVDTALKIALAYHRARGEGTAHPADRPRARLPRRRLRRHLGGRHLPATARCSAPCWGVDHLPPHPQPRRAMPSAKGLARGRWRRTGRRAGAPRRAA
jgi:hypothetical protein